MISRIFALMHYINLFLYFFWVVVSLVVILGTCLLNVLLISTSCLSVTVLETVTKLNHLIAAS